MKVSVVVPVYDPGSYVDSLIESFLRQSLPAGEVEAVFVDDGSTDGTGERLDALAAEHENVRVIHIPNSGWPGRPRNVGLDAARGDFVFFADADDWLGDEALERLHAAAVGTDADIVIGKVVGRGKWLSRSLFHRNAAQVRVGEEAIHELLTVHKLFRREFLLRTGLRHPEGHVRLEDQMFVLQAYFQARGISIVSDYPCYHWRAREDGHNISLGAIERSYWRDLAKVLDIVEAHTDPGPFRDELLVEWYSWPILRRLGGKLLFRWPEPFRGEMVQDMRDLALKRFGDGVTGRLPAALRVRARLLEAGRCDGLEALARRESEITADLRLGGARWEDGVLRLTLHGGLVAPDGRGPALRRDESGALSLVLPDGLPGADGLAPADVAADADLPRAEVRAFVRRRGTREEYVLPAVTSPRLRDDGPEVVVELDAVAEFDPATAAAGAPLPAGVFDVLAEVRMFGLVRSRRVTVGAAVMPPAALVGVDARPVRAFTTVHGKLSLDVDEHQKPLLAGVRGAAADADAVRRGRRIDVAVRVPVVLAGTGDDTRAELVLHAAGRRPRHVHVPARAIRDGEWARLEAQFPFSPLGRPGTLGPGKWTVSVALGSRRARLALALMVGRAGRVRLHTADTTS